jgi:mRNA interferase MazF
MLLLCNYCIVINGGRVNQGEVYSIEIKQGVGSEVQGKGAPPKRPCVIISPDALNKYRNTVMVAPLTSTQTGAPFRASAVINGRDGEIMLDQIFTVDKSRFTPQSKMGSLSSKERIAVLDILRKIFQG